MVKLVLTQLTGAKVFSKVEANSDFFAKKVPGTVEKVGQITDELKVQLNDIIQYRQKYQLWIFF